MREECAVVFPWDMINKDPTDHHHHQKSSPSSVSSPKSADTFLRQQKQQQHHEEIKSSKIRMEKRRRRERHRKHEDEGSMGCGGYCCFGFLLLIVQILLNGVMALTLYWIMKYHSSTDPQTGSPLYFSWRGAKNYSTTLGFNLHPVLMIAGFIYFSGQSMLMYRTYRCCRRIWNKLLHAVFHMLAIPCICFGFIAVLDSHDLRTTKDESGQEIPAPIPNFYSLHSWMGLATMGLFALQFTAGFFSFLFLLCCESATASFRSAMVPIHSVFGISTFVMAAATACAGLTEKAFFSMSAEEYSKFPTEGWITNAIGAGLFGLAVLIPFFLRCRMFGRGIRHEGQTPHPAI